MRSRRTRAEAPDTGMDVSVPAAGSEMLGYCKDETVEIVLRITTHVVSGTMRRGDLEQWFRAALREHYARKNRTVGYTALAEITMPTCVRIDKVRDAG